MARSCWDEAAIRHDPGGHAQHTTEGVTGGPHFTAQSLLLYLLTRLLKRRTLRSTMPLQSRRVKANGREPFTTERGLLGMLESPASSAASRLHAAAAAASSAVAPHSGFFLPPPPPPPPASSPAALRMRTAGHVRYLLRGDSESYDITV